MTQPEIRADVVALLVDVDFSRCNSFTDNPIHCNGQPYTTAEIALVGSATWDELEASMRYEATVQEFRNQRVRDVSRLVELTHPYYARPGVKTLKDVMPLMTDEERSELEALLDGLAPDGTLILPTAS